MIKFVKIENPGYPDFVEYDFIIEENEDSYKCKERKLNKDFKITGTCLTWRFLSSDEENDYIQDMRTIPVIDNADLIDDIRRMSYNISREDLCSDGRDLWYIVERYISERLKALNVEERFFYFWCGSYYLATNGSNYDSTDWRFKQISKELWEIIQNEDSN